MLADKKSSSQKTKKSASGLGAEENFDEYFDVPGQNPDASMLVLELGVCHSLKLPFTQLV